ncbi:hypothetical protein ACFX13_013122 [Malus domestica]
MTIKLKYELIVNSFKTIDGRCVNVHVTGGGCITPPVCLQHHHPQHPRAPLQARREHQHRLQPYPRWLARQIGRRQHLPHRRPQESPSP